jgi:hypothetical protein
MKSWFWGGSSGASGSDGRADEDNNVAERGGASSSSSGGANGGSGNGGGSDGQPSGRRVQFNEAEVESSCGNSRSSSSSGLSRVSVTDDRVQQLLQFSRESINSGDKDGALEALIRAITLTRGPDAVMEVLSRGRDMVDQADRARRQAEVQNQQQSLRMERQLQERALREAIDMCESLMNSDCILTERDDGSEEILRDAFQDGSSVVCKMCGGLVKRERWDQHRTGVPRWHEKM